MNAKSYKERIKDIELNYSVRYNRQKFIDILKPSSLDLNSVFDIKHLYATMGTYGWVVMSRQEISWECEYFMSLIIAVIN